MSRLLPMKLDDGTIIYIESSDDVEIPDMIFYDEQTPVTKGGGMDLALEKYKAMEATIRAYTTQVLNVFQEFAAANVEKVQLEFGVKIGGEAGIPYVTKGTAESNLKITVDFSFPDKDSVITPKR